MKKKPRITKIVADLGLELAEMVHTTSAFTEEGESQTIEMPTEYEWKRIVAKALQLRAVASSAKSAESVDKKGRNHGR